MATVYISHDPEDRAFVESTVLPPLPGLGFEWWLSADPSTSAFQSCRAIIVIVSDAARRSPTVRSEALTGLEAARPTIVIQRDKTQPEEIAPALRSLPVIAAIDTARGLALQLPSVVPSDDGAPKGALQIAWHDQEFSNYLQDAIGKLDFSRGEFLVGALARHIQHRPRPYPTDSARRDLSTLRSRRQFLLMERYADLVLQSGNTDLQVRRQFGQALIEQGRLDEALPVLQAVASEAPPTDNERAEGFGLIGRLFKQRYVNDPKSAAAPEHLRRSIDAYYQIYRDEPDRFWHGVNTASLLVRAGRDGVQAHEVVDAQSIATAILKRFDELRAAGKVDVWDFASRVEALVALRRFDEAADALDEYLAHRGMNAFEVSSTFRQFDEVLELRKAPEGGALVERLWRAVDRFRAGGATTSAQQRENVTRPDLRPIVLRVSDPGWSAGDIAGLTIGTRLGTVITARATDAAIQMLLKDPIVIAVEESRTVVDVATNECARGMPFINVCESYTDSAGTFDEKGRHALIAIVDDGIDVLHEAFTDEHGQPRILGIWDQRDETGPPPDGFEYGTYHAADDIKRYVATGVVEKTLGRNVDGHGTHVASIAAGRAVGSVFRGVAPEARVLVVRTKSDGDIGYSISHLEALAFIDRVATELKYPVVVNVSKGMNAAAHDGKSALEIGFDEFCSGGRKPGRVVVKSAGNEGDTAGHAEITVPPGGARQLRWMRTERFGFERIELWWSAADSLMFTLRSPGGAASPPVSDAAPDVSGDLAAGGKFHMQLTKRHPDNGDSRLLIQLGEGTNPLTGGVRHGPWTLDVVSVETLSGKPIHAWIARLGGEPSAFQTDASPRMTITVPGTAQSVIAVGAIDAREPTFLGPFSSSGPTRDGREKPDLAAPGVDVIAARGGTSHEARQLSGTSMAAPHVAGAVALVLSRAVSLGKPCPSANQIASALRQKTKRYNGHHDSGQGYGVVDIGKILGAF